MVNGVRAEVVTSDWEEPPRRRSSQGDVALRFVLDDDMERLEGTAGAGTTAAQDAARWKGEAQCDSSARPS